MTELKEQLHKAKADVQAVQEQAYALRLKSREAIADVKKFYADAAELKKMRDAENEKVREFKKKRQEAESKVTEAIEKLKPLRGQLDGLPRAESPGRLRAELERLEWEQQTEAVSPKAEKELSRRIKDLREQLAPAEKARGVFEQIKPLEENLRAATAEVRIYRTELAKHAKASDAHHEAMLKLYKKAESLSKKIGENLKQLDEKRALLDEERKEFFQIQGQVKGAEKAQMDARRAEEKAERDRIQAEKEAERNAIKQKATGIAEKALEKFRAGGKLTWEDLQAIQEAGLELK
ncbi:hypothetical protein HYV43_05155 [Candidatus Micrarchaeota archaeon]|nr:hypothetical protein [Candidatus Micrarchaeota archaeon]